VTGEGSARSPLEERAGDLETVGARLLASLTQFDLRVDPANAGRSPYPLPLEPNTSAERESVETLWLGPDEWLIVGPLGSAGDLTSALGTTFAGIHHSIVDVSANRVAMELIDDDRAEMLSHVCSLDLEPPAWVVGRCAQTLVGRAQALLHERPDTTRLFVRPSFAGYVVDLLLEVRRVRGDVRA
jgi:sarcosine oxidase, subunit gamma